MTIAAGTKLGRYEIRSKIGAGGMGEVYRARDEKLNRDVAIKVLPASLSQDADRLRRFEQEAQAAGALNHPNILAVYDVGVHEGSPYIVSELLEGEELREQLNDGSLQQRKALDYAQQIAQGLAAAHERGITHRDLKPENLFISADSRVKILDFGLAKLRPHRNESVSSEIDTRRQITDPGTVMGTVGYMSPEQVRGQQIDNRSDIFSFGLILYEMLTGKRAFEGNSAVELMNSILKEEPEELTGATSTQINPTFERIVRRCLEKKPEHRFQTASDLAFALGTLSDISGDRRVAAASTPVAMKRRYLAVPFGLMLLLIGTVGGLMIGGRNRQTPLPSFQRLTFRRGFIPDARFAPDGQTVVYSAEWEGKPVELYEVSTASAESRPLGIPNADLLALSSTGEMAISLAPKKGINSYFRVGTLARAPLTGGAPREVLEGVSYADWSPDGKNIAVMRALDGRYHLEFPIGHQLYETADFIASPRVSPQGDRIAFFESTSGQDLVTVNVVDLTRKKTTLSRGWSDWEFLAWLPEGDEVLFGASETGTLSAIYSVDLAGHQRLVLRAPGTVEIRDVSRAGRILLTRVDVRDVIFGVPPGEKTERDLSWLDGGRSIDFSADGKSLLISMHAEAGKATGAVYLRKTDASTAVRLGEGEALSLSADGKWALAKLKGTPLQLFALPTGPGEVKRFKVDRFADIDWANWFPDGKRILLSAAEVGHSLRLYILDVASSEARPITPEGVRLNTYGNAISPDGQYAAAVGTDQKVALYPISGGEPKSVPGIEPGERMIEWSADGRSLYLFRRGELPARIFRVEIATGRRELWRELKPPDPAGVGTLQGVRVTPDGQSYCYSYAQTLSELYIVEGLKPASGWPLSR